jgi:NADH-quinone oxidoreductase subunit N
MEQQWNDHLNNILGSFSGFVPELVLSLAFIVLLILALFKTGHRVLVAFCFLGCTGSVMAVMMAGLDQQQLLFNGMLKADGIAAYLKILMGISGALASLMSLKRSEHAPEYFALIVAVVLGGNLLVMSSHFLMIFLSLELISLCSYVLAGYSFTRHGSEGSIKYFLFGSVASAIMLYGFSLLYGITGTLDFSSATFIEQLLTKNSSLALLASLMVLSGFLYKISAAPMHLWAPDVYEAAPIPVIAFLSVAPKMAGLGVLLKFTLTINLFGHSVYDWQTILCALAMLTITVGNFSALRQQNAKRLMAYSSIAQSGFLMVGIAAFLPQGIHFMLFYATVYLAMNFLVFICLDFFDKRGITTLQAFQGTGKEFIVPSIFLLTGLVALTGLPPTAGFTAKLLIFSSLWQSYEFSGKTILLVLLIFGLVNTVVSLFYYLRIPYFAFLKSGQPSEKQNIITFENLLGLILVLVILILFFLPGLLMGWINKTNFVL